MRKHLLIGAIAVGLLAPLAAQAQVNVVPQVGQINSIVKSQTYAAVSRGLAPAASATDLFCISGSASRSISVKRIEISGTAGTLVTAPFTLVRRVTLDSGGTLATGAALPVGTAMLSTNAASTATLAAYTANPTVNDSSPTYFRSQWLTLPVTSAGTSVRPIVWDFSTSQDILAQGLDIAKGNTTYQYCINLNGVSVSSGLIDINILWTEN